MSDPDYVVIASAVLFVLALVLGLKTKYLRLREIFELLRKESEWGTTDYPIGTSPML